MIQLSADARIVNQADAARFSFPSSAGSALGARPPSPISLRIGNAHRIRKTTAIASVAKIAFAGACIRSETAPSHSGTWRSRLHASAIRLMKITYTGMSRNGNRVEAAPTTVQMGHSSGWATAPRSWK